jgi:competence protein ComEC
MFMTQNNAFRFKIMPVEPGDNQLLPSNKVKHRYQQQGYQWLDTPHQGQVTVNFSAQGWRISSLREQILPRWYHQWFGVPVDNG